MAKKNFLLGNGERLTEDISVRSGGGPKDHPYTFTEALRRLSPMISRATLEIDKLPDYACPRDQAVISLTLNPEYISKSYFPKALLREVGFEVVGSRPKKIKPEKRSRGRESVEAITTELFARGVRANIRSWDKNLQNWEENQTKSQDLISIEAVSVSAPQEKIKGDLPETGILPMEIVLHASEIEAQTYLLRDFQVYLDKLGLEATFGRRFFAKGLCFLEVDAPVERADEIAVFSMVRALRQMPGMRVLRPTIRSSDIPTNLPELPQEPPVSKNIRVAIFDGGIPNGHPLKNWVRVHELPGLHASTNEFLSHGVAVTSAALFGHINPREQIPQPYSHIDHYRVLDAAPGQDFHELYEVLERIETVLSAEEFDFVNLSIGPRLPIEDDDIHAWTAVLDERFSRTSTLATVAVGNDGDGDSELGLDRVQVPADCVNALAVGACDTPGHDWKRAPYSSVGPGRSPGRTKPDLVDFGGEVDRPFVVLTPDVTPALEATAGTSLATPSVMRQGVGIRAYFGGNLNHLAIRALLIHTAEEGKQDHKEIGWGRVAQDLKDIVLCDDDTVRVVYQGEISPAKYIRARIPVPHDEIQGTVLIKATVCYKSQTDPHHPSNYTRAGLDVKFRPHDGKFSRDGQLHPDSASFFGPVRTGAIEDPPRRDARKWENCLHASKRKRGSSLRNPCFDIHYNSRMEGRGSTSNQKLAYVLVVTVQAKSISDLYDQIVRKYVTRLKPLMPVLELSLRT